MFRKSIFVIVILATFASLCLASWEFEEGAEYVYLNSDAKLILPNADFTAGDTGEKLIRWLAPVGFPGDESATVIAQPKPLERDYKDAKRDLRDASAIIVPPM
jgi:hypothetical protein